MSDRPIHRRFRRAVRASILVSICLVIAACGSSASSNDSSSETTSTETTATASAATGGDTTSTEATAAPATTPRTSPPTTDAKGRNCDGGAFPQDEEFRFLVCDVQYLQLDVAAAGRDIDPEWITRAQTAILTYDRSRATSVAILEELKVEMMAVLDG